MNLREPIRFIRETARNFDEIGAVLPSSRFLAKRITSPLANSCRKPLRVLEVGAGTGAITRHIVRRLSGRDALDICEINPSFAQSLRRRFASNGSPDDALPSVRVIEDSVLHIPDAQPYDFIISGLPLNAFEPDLVAEVLEKYAHLMVPDGTLLYFEYCLVRRLCIAFGRKCNRERARAVDRVLSDFTSRYPNTQRTVIWNVPPAYVRQISLASPEVSV